MSDLHRRIAALSPQKRALLQKWLARGEPAPVRAEIPSSGARDGAPLSFAQQRLWFLHRLDPASPEYNMPMVLRLRGPLDLQALQGALEGIVRRHEVLRTTFEERDGEPVQRIPSTFEVVIRRRDLAPASRLEDVLREEVARPFDLERDPALRVLLIGLGPDDHVLQLTVHHVASDLWSFSILLDELQALYRSGPRESLPAPPIQYADYARWQRELLGDERLAGQIAYWSRQLQQVSVLDLPTDRPRPASASHRGAVLPFDLSPELSDSLRELGRSHDATLFMTLMAAFHVLLHRYTGRTDIAVGTPVAGRNRPELETLVGFFANMLVLRTDLDDNPRFVDFLARVRRVALEAYSHQDLPFERLVEELAPSRDASRTPLFQVAFSLQTDVYRRLDFGRLQAERIRVDPGTAKFELSLFVIDRESGLEGTIEYSTDLFDAATIERMARHWRNLLAAIVAQPTRRVAEFRLQPPEECWQLLEKVNGPRRRPAPDASLHELFERVLDRHAPALAVVHGEHRLTYQELNVRSNRLAHCLRELGVVPETPVAICLPPSADRIVAHLGVVKSGGAYVPLDLDDPRSRWQSLLEDAGVSVVVAHRGLAADAFPGRTRLDLDADPRISAQATDDPAVVNTAADLAYVMYTSGSTGRPKGVAVPQRAVSRLVCDPDYVTLRPGDRIAHVSNPAFDAATFEIWGALLNGAAVVVLPKDVVLSPAGLGAELAARDITTMFLTTALFHEIARSRPDTFSSLKQVLFGGEAVDPECVRRVLLQGPPERLVHVYGPTENTTFSTWHEVGDVAPGSTTVPIGKPIAGTRVYLLDEQLEPVPLGIPGELYVAGDGLAREYLHRPELTARCFLPDPLDAEPGARMYRTGDRCRFLPDGSLVFLGRLDHQIKRRGFRIELGEIEALLRGSPGVEHCVVATHEVEGDLRLTAYVTNPVGARNGWVEELREVCATHLPRYMIPTDFVVLDRMPLTPSGKIDRRALPVPGATHGAAPPAPRNELEEVLLAVFQEVLKREIGIHESFFDAGGHSLLAVRLVSRIEGRLQRRLPLSTLFQASSVAQLARVLSQSLDPSLADQTLVAIQPEGSRPPLFLVHGVGGLALDYPALVKHLGRDQPLYALQARGIDGRHEIQTRIEDMATTYIEEIRRIQPRGGYCLSGYSLGGTIAFEMAQQLARAGEPVAFLGILDHPAPGRRRRWTPGSAANLLMNLPCWVLEAARHPGDSLSRLRSKLRLLTRRRQRSATGGQHREVDDVLDMSAWPDAMQELARVHYQAYLRYSPAPYPGKITVLRARRQSLFKPFQKHLGWLPLAAGGIRLHVIPGGHGTMFHEPNVAILAALLREELARA